MIRHLVLALAAFFLAGAAPGQAFSQEKLRVVATSADLKSLVEAVGGERVAVESLAAPEQDPHSIEVKPAQLARLRSDYPGLEVREPLTLARQVFVESAHVRPVRVHVAFVPPRP